MRRRLAAGDSKRGGGARDRRSGDHSGGGDHPREAQTRARLVVQVGGAGVAGAAGGEPLCGCRSSGNLGVGVREHGRRSWGVLRTPEITVSTSVGSDTSWGGCGHGHAMAGGERFSGKVVGLAREGGGARGEGESGRGLTAVLLVLLARQGRHGVRRIDGGELRWPATERRW